MFKLGTKSPILAFGITVAITGWLGLQETAHAETVLASETSGRTIEFTQPTFNLGVEQETFEHKWVEFSVEESNEAIARFGCDDPFCINALREQRGLPPLQLDVDYEPSQAVRE